MMQSLRLLHSSLVAFLLVLLLPGAARGQSPGALVGAGSEPIDLTDFYGKASGTEGDSWFTHPDWKIVPKGLQEFDGILFDVSGTMLLRSQNMPQLKAAIRGIPVHRLCRYIHLLAATGYADPDGTTIAVMEVHYTNEAVRQFPIIYGVHVRNWWKEKGERISTVFSLGSDVAWHGQGKYPPPERASVRLYRCSFLNPMPRWPIDHLDFVSKNSQSILCIVSISVGDKKPQAAAKPGP